MTKDIVDKLPARRLQDACRWGVTVWLIARVALSSLGAILWSENMIPMQSPFGNLYFDEEPIRDGVAGALVGVWQRWDGVHYQQIAEHGYTEESLSAFFPLYPLLARSINLLTGIQTFLALILVSNLALILAMILLYELVEDLFSPTHAKLAVIALILFPTAFFLFTPYAQSLILFLALFAYRAARHSQWRLALITGIAAGLTHPTAIPLAALLGWETWQHYKTSGEGRNFIRALTMLGPLIGTGIFLLWRSQNGYTPFTTTLDYWGRSAQWPWQTILALPDLFRTGMFFTSGWGNVTILVVVIISTIWGIKNLPTGLSLYQCIALIYLLSTTNTQLEPLSGFGRYSLVIFPIFIAIASWCLKPWRRLAIQVISAFANLYFVVQFILWRWVS